MRALRVAARVVAIAVVLWAVLVLLLLIGVVTAVGLLYTVAVILAPSPDSPDLAGPLLALVAGSAACSALPRLLRRRR